jgi:predicted ferric reductase
VASRETSIRRSRYARRRESSACRRDRIDGPYWRIRREAGLARGFVDTDVFERHLPEPYDEHEYFICGPDVMMDAIERALGALHVPKPKYHSERYSFV